MVTLCLDLGQKRIGIAVSDAEGQFAFGLPTLDNKGKEAVMDHLRNLIQERDVKKIVLGLPLHMSGKESRGAVQSLQWKKWIEDELHIDVATWDERLSSRTAERAMLDGDLSRKKRKKMIDRLSAQIILQDYLTFLRIQKEGINEAY